MGILIGVAALSGCIEKKEGVTEKPGGQQQTEKEPGVLTPEVTAKTMTGFGMVRPLSWAVYTDGSGVITMVNNGGAIIALTNASGDCTFTLPADTSISTGEVFQITASGCSTGSADDAYDIDVTLKYSKKIAGMTERHSSTGKIKGPYEEK
ncbi:MAG: hypothetical protein A7316_10060 [Candidatus Altiarchaeales archaeon WOR_SM1_86-2]|nr:MAG: hypothetical protein A7316_10060 [Candidatus Altiarchaeales archaeon WOR_SM1_86-2]